MGYIENDFKPLKVMELKDKNFFIPDYQRGYRWTKNEVKTLLDDIYKFKGNDSFLYCLQPLIVKERDDGSYEVVDGQQRLTTIYIFMKIAQQEIRSATPMFEIKYGTKEENENFLKSLSDDMKLDEEANKNIDYYYIVQAYKTINEWLDSKDDKSVAIQELNSKIRTQVFFIWYQLPKDSNSIDRFRKVNLGRIPLTNAELIKALFMNSKNFIQYADKKQIEISISWDRIEYGLQDNSFWYFLTDDDSKRARIGLLFDLLAEEENKKLEEEISINQRQFSFLVFYKRLENCKTTEEREKYIDGLWFKIEEIYALLREWYEDLNKYHIIG
ncbi:MAG: DUF262 domain-containing protein, partial [Lachnospirales bacterium]